MGNAGQDGGFFLKLGCRGCLKLGCQEPAWGWSGLSKRKQGIEYGTVTGLANQKLEFYHQRMYLCTVDMGMLVGGEDSQLFNNGGIDMAPEELP